MDNLSLLSRIFESKYNCSYRLETEFKKRCEDSKRIRAKYPQRIPIIIEPHKDIKISKLKYLVPQDITIGEFLAVIRKKCEKLGSDQAIYLFLENQTLPPINKMINQIDKDHRNVDGFIYILTTLESSFGMC